MQNDFIIALAWPEGMVAKTDVWYDKFFAKNGKLIAVTKIINRCKTEDIIILLFIINYLCLYGSDIKATLVNPEPDNKPIISNTLP